MKRITYQNRPGSPILEQALERDLRDLIRMDKNLQFRYVVYFKINDLGVSDFNMKVYPATENSQPVLLGVLHRKQRDKMMQILANYNAQ